MNRNGCECRNTKCPLFDRCAKSDRQWIYALASGKFAGKRIVMGSAECAGNWYYGITGFIQIWHGMQSDPELVYHGIHADENSILDPLLTEYRDLQDEGELPDDPDDAYFDDWIYANLEKLIETMEDYGDALRNGTRKTTRIDYVEK